MSNSFKYLINFEKTPQNREIINFTTTHFFPEYGFIPAFVALVFGGCILTFSQFLCASVCSALTASLVLVGKSIVQTVIGFFTFGGVEPQPLNIFGIILNICGGALYSFVKYREKKSEQESEMEPLLSEKERSSQTLVNVHQKDENDSVKSNCNETENSVDSKTSTSDKTKSNSQE